MLLLFGKYLTTESTKSTKTDRSLKAGETANYPKHANPESKKRQMDT